MCIRDREKIYAAREAYEKQQLDDYLDEISYKEAMGKYDDNQAQKIADLTYAYNKLAKKKEDLRKLEQQIYKETKAYQEAEAKKAKDAADAIEDIVDMRMKYIRKEQELKKMLGVYFEQNVTTETFEDFDGDRWVIVGE